MTLQSWTGTLKSIMGLTAQMMTAASDALGMKKNSGMRNASDSSTITPEDRYRLSDGVHIINVNRITKV